MYSSDLTRFPGIFVDFTTQKRSHITQSFEAWFSIRGHVYRLTGGRFFFFYRHQDTSDSDVFGIRHFTGLVALTIRKFVAKHRMKSRNCKVVRCTFIRPAGWMTVDSAWCATRPPTTAVPIRIRRGAGRAIHRQSTTIGRAPPSNDDGARFSHRLRCDAAPEPSSVTFRKPQHWHRPHPGDSDVSWPEEDRTCRRCPATSSPNTCSAGADR